MKTRNPTYSTEVRGAGGSTQWTNSAPSFEVDITTGADIYTMRIDANTDCFDGAAGGGVWGNRHW